MIREKKMKNYELWQKIISTIRIAPVDIKTVPSITKNLYGLIAT